MKHFTLYTLHFTLYTLHFTVMEKEEICTHYDVIVKIE